MVGGGILVEVTTSNSIEPLLSSKTSYERSLSRVGEELRSFRSCLRWMCVIQFDVKHTIVYWSLFLLLGIFISIASHFVLSYVPTCRVHDVVVQLSFISAFDLSYFCLFAFVHRYSLHRFLFLDKMKLFFKNLNYICHYINDLL
ncbi:hypothetical protein GW17_00052322 [Ensete ventricosum]|nr:hypothetical protein GW17_00052322 [Ensete ventricosum]